MSEHYQRNVCGIMKYCNRCGKLTIHKVSGKRLGLCTENHNTATPEKKEKPEPEPSLF